MKALNTRCRTLFAIVMPAILLLAVVRVSQVFAQSDTMTAPAASAASDVSVFPSLDKLPGKVPPQVWTGLAGTWARAHKRWQATASRDVGAVVFLGDSITEQWTSLSNDFPNLHVANRGISGDITSGVLYRLKADVLDLNPSAIVLLIGTNDEGDGAQAEDIADNTKSILQAIKKFNAKLKVIVCKIMPRGKGETPPEAEKIKKANALIGDYVKTEPNFAVCDTWGSFADANGAPNPVDFKPDLLHLNPAGYAVWKSALDPVLAKLGITKP